MTLDRRSAMAQQVLNKKIFFIGIRDHLVEIIMDDGTKMTMEVKNKAGIDGTWDKYVELAVINSTVVG